MKESTRFVLFVVVAVAVLYYVGAMFGFLPFLSQNQTVAAIGFSTILLSTLIAICTVLILKHKD